MRFARLLRVSAVAVASVALVLGATVAAEGIPMERGQTLSVFGERPAFSPDGTRVAFVGKAFGDAYEIEIATGRIRNLTANAPHQGVLRIQYLPNGDYLISGPRRNTGPDSRLRLDFFVLDKDLKRGLQPLGEQGVEGVAIGRNLVAWQSVRPGALQPGEGWVQGMLRLGLEQYVGRIEFREGTPRLVDKRRIMNPNYPGCAMSEVQDFRKNDGEVIFYCGGQDEQKNLFMAVFGYDLNSGNYITYAKRETYTEVEGIAPDGTWTTVECGNAPPTADIPVIDICRLELVPNGEMTPLIIGSAPGTTRKVNNPVVSPDGKWVAFASGDAAIGDHGEAAGIHIVQIGK